MKYVVTGGAGFIGSNIVETLVEKGEDVVVIDDLSTGKKEKLDPFLDKIDFIEGSITDPDLLKKEFNGADYVLHLAAMASVPQSVADPVECDEINTRGTLNVLLAAKEAGVKRVVLSSSCAVYGDSPELPKREDMVPNPLSPYALTKLNGEQYCKLFSKLYGLETVCLRYFNVFGPKQDPKSQYSAVIPIFITKLLNNEQPIIFGDGTQSRDFIYVKNVVEANLKACVAEGVSGEVLNIGSGTEVSLIDLLNKINVVLGKDISSTHESARDGDIKRSVGDVSKAKSVLEFKADIDFDTGLKETVSWYSRK